MRRASVVLLLLAALFCFQQNSRAGWLPLVKASAGGGCTEATNFLTRSGSTTHDSDYTTLICGLVTDTVWSSIDALYIFATDTSAHALLSLVSATFNASVVGSPTFTANQGYGSANSADLLTTNFNPATATSPQFVQNSASYGYWGYADLGAGSTSVSMGNSANGTSGESNLFPRYSDNNLYPCVNSATCGGIANTQTQGLITADRFSSSAIHAYRNGSEIGTGITDTSASPESAAIRILGATGSNFFPGQISAAYIGASLGATKQGQLYTRIRTYMTAVGVP